MTAMVVRQSTTLEQPLQASKWLKVQALISGNECAHLFQFLEETVGSFFLYSCGVVCNKEKGAIDKQEFLDFYGAYIHSLMSDKIPDLALYRGLFSPVMTMTTDALFSIPVGEDREIIRVSKPVIQLQAHHMDYSTVDKKFHSMVFGIDSIAWGIQFSYPQLYQDTVTKEVEIIKRTKTYPNTVLFQRLQKWMRQYTIPTPFIAEGDVINVPMRLGKECFVWINQHPQLVQKNISVRV
jgi:hypothetical protein